MSGPVVTQSGDISLNRDPKRGGGGRSGEREVLRIGKEEGRGVEGGCMTTLHVITVFVVIFIFITSICNVHYGTGNHDISGHNRKNHYANRQRDIAIIIMSLLGLVTSIPTTYLCIKNVNK